MDAVKELLSNKLSAIPSQFVPFITVGMVVVAVLLVIIFFGFCVIYVNSKPKPIVRRDATKDDGKKAVAPQKIRHEDLPILSGRLGEILSMYGFIHAGAITKIFFQVMDIIKNSTYDLRWRYKLPCFMMVGAEKSGKTTLLNSLNLEYLTADGSAVDSMWKLFKKGVIFELPKTELKEDEPKFWSFISELFMFIRPRRPLDGIIVTIPADMLLSDAAVERHATDMFNKIFKFQSEVNFRLPIYLIVTKSDLITGFSEFAHLLHESSKQQMFGWSNPYALNSAFSITWADEAFKTITDGIRKAAIHFAQEKAVSEDLEKAIIFESEIGKTKPALTAYLNAMFHAHNPAAGLILRGIYFVGQQKQIEEASAELLQPTALSPQLLTNVNYSAAYNNSLYFLQDLFTEKIFKEYNLAHPISVDSIDVGQVSFRNKAILTGTVITFSLGWFFGNNNIKNKIHEYYRELSSIKTAVQQVRKMEVNLKSPLEQKQINRRMSTLLQKMPVAKRWDLTSIFVPQSWFSGLHHNIKNTLGLVFDSVVIRAMYIDLNLNTNNFLQDIENGANASHKKKDLFDVKSFKSFKNLSEFVGKVASLKKLSSEYNAVRNLEDRNSIIDLTNTLFKDTFEIAQEMKNHVPNRKLMPPKFDIDMFRPKIENGLRNLFSAFLKDTLDVTIEKILENIAQDIEHISEVAKTSSTKYSQAQLAKTYSKLTLLSEILKNKNFSWISQEHFAPTKEYTDLINTLKSSDVISPECTESLIKQAETEFQRYKARLRDFKTELTGELLAANIQSPSAGLESLKKELHALLGQDFIKAVPPTNFTAMVLDDKMLFWDVKRLRALSEMVDKYYTFAETMPADMRAQYYDMYKIVAQKCFVPTVESLLGGAQLFEDAPLGSARQLIEDAYKRQATNIRNASAVLPKIVKFLESSKEDNDGNSVALTQLIVSHYSSQLEKIDALFNLETPYATGNAVFDNWNGNQKPKFLDIDSEAGIREYLTAQFERIRFLAKDLASPIIDLFSAPYISEQVTAKRLVAKWKEIITSVDDYEAKKPGNSIAALEEFMTNSLSKVTVTGFDKEGEIKNISQTSGDFFLSKRSEVAKSLLSRVDVIQYDKAAEAYNSMSSFFNDNLSNKFPFGDSSDDATLRDVETFVDMFEKNCKNIVETLEQNKTHKNVSQKAINFLKSTDKIMPFLKNWVKHSKGSDASTSTILFKVQLRPTPDAEAYTSSVIERKITIDGVAVENDENKPFFNGNKVDAIFRWVGSADEQPNEQAAEGVCTIEGSQAQFSFGGQWAMFKLIETHKLNKGIEYPEGVTVQFNVPIIDKSQNNLQLTSKMILKITPMLKEEDKVNPIAWPVFPTICPDLHANDSDSQPANDDNQSTEKLDVDVSFDDNQESAAEAEGESND